MQSQHYTYPKWVRVMEITAIAAYAVYCCLVVADVKKNLEMVSLSRIWLFGILPLLTYLAADVISGLVHCAADNLGSPSTPVFGPALIRPFRDHHADPEGITRHDFIETNGNSCLISLMILVPIYHLGPSSPGGIYLSVEFFFLILTFFAVMTNQIHKWAHMAVPPRFVARLQRWHLILTPTIHQIHHTKPFDRYYSITNGWTNSFLEKAHVFEGLVNTFGSPPQARRA